MDNNEKMRIDPESGEVMFSPEFQERVKERLDSAREAVGNGVGQFMLDLTKKQEHHPDYMAAAILETGLQLAAIAFGEERLAEKLRQQVDENDNIVDAVTNVGSMIVLDRLVEDFKNAEKKEQELRRQGRLTLEEGAERIGISPEDLAERLESLDKRAEKLGISTNELMRLIDDGKEEMV